MSDDKVVRLGSKKPKNEPVKEEEQQSEVVYCSFCKRPNTQVIKMVKGPNVNICSECTMIAVQYLILFPSLKQCTGRHQTTEFHWHH